MNKIDFIAPDTFRGLYKLKKINLSANHLKSINFDTFKGLSNLKEINLDNNRLESIDARVFSDATKLRMLKLSQNPICQTRPDYVKKLLSTSHPTCEIDINDGCVIS